jgi:hypothetical protein
MSNTKSVKPTNKQQPSIGFVILSKIIEKTMQNEGIWILDIDIGHG